MRTLIVDSSNVKQLKHNEEDILTVEYNSGAVYEYHGVNLDRFASIAGAISIGSFLPYAVRDIPYKKILNERSK